MTRWFFAVLVLANLALWMWASWYQERAVGEAEAPRPQVHAEQMKLLTEPGVKLKPRPKPPEANAEAEAAVVVPRHCYRAGPFAELDAAIAAGKGLEARGIGHMRQEETRPAVTGYRVFLPPFPSREAAERKRKELARLGFQDHALTQEGGRYAISLGLYSIEANAIAHQQRLAAKGVAAKLEPIRQARTAYWLELSGENLFEALKDFGWGAAGVSLSELACPASPPPPAPAAPAAPPEEDADARGR